MTNSFDEARKEGYSDDEILDYYSSKNPDQKSKFDSARQEGYSSSDILNHISQNSQEKPSTHPLVGAEKLARETTESVLRLPGEFGLGAIEAYPYVLGLEAIGQAATALHTSDNVKAANFKHTATETYLDLAQRKEFGNWSEQDEEKLQKSLQIAQLTPKEIIEGGYLQETPKFAPSTLINMIPGQEPRNVAEKGARLIGMFRQAGVTGAEKLGQEVSSKLSKVLSPQVAKEIEGIAATAPLATGAVAMNETFGTPEWMTIAIGGMGSLLYKGLRSGISWAGRKFGLFDPAKVSPYHVPSSVKAELAAARENAVKQVEEGIMSPEMYESISPYLDVAEQYGIPLVPSAVTDSRYFKAVEKMILENDITGAAVQEFRQEAAKAWGEAQRTASKDMQRNLIFSEPGAVAESMLDNVTRTKHIALKEESKALYETAATELAQTKNISSESVKEIEASLNRVAEKARSESLIPTSAEKAASEAATEASEKLLISPSAAGKAELEGLKFPTGKELRAVEEQQAGRELNERRGATAKMRTEAKAQQAAKRQSETKLKSQQDLEKLYGEDAKYMRIDEDGNIRLVKNINGKTLTDTIRSLNDRMDWDNPQVVNLFQDTRKTLQNVLEKEYSKTNPKALQAQKEANKLHAESQRLFGQDARWKKWGLKQDVLPDDLLRTINNVERLKAFEKDFPEAKELLDHFYHLKVQEKLTPLFEARAYDPGKIADGIAKLERDPMFMHMVSDKTLSNLKDLAKLDAHLERTSRNFFAKNPASKEATGLFVATKSIFNPELWILKIGEKLGKERAAQVYADILLDPKFTSRIKQLGEESIKAAESGSLAKAQKAKANIDLFWEEVLSTAQASSTSYVND